MNVGRRLRWEWEAIVLRGEKGEDVGLVPAVLFDQRTDALVHAGVASCLLGSRPNSIFGAGPRE